MQRRVAVALVEDHDGIEAFAPERTDNPLDVAFCQGDRGAVTTSVTPIDSTPTTEINDWVL